MKIVHVVCFLFMIYIVCGKPTQEEDYDYLDEDEPMQKDHDDEEYGTDEEEENVQNLPPSIPTKPQDFIVKPDKTLSLPCTVINGEKYVIVWKKEDTILFQDAISLVDQVDKEKYERRNGSLVIKNIQDSDGGNYTCAVLLPTTENLSVTHHVILGSAPKIKSLKAQNNTRVLKAGDTLILTCSASGVPPPKIKWYFRDEPMDLGGEVLEIENVGQERAGEYRCMADNKIEPPAHMSRYITILHKPVVRIEKMYSNDTQKLELVCVVHSNPQAKILWRVNGTALDRSNKNISRRQKNNQNRLIFKEFGEEDFGRYSCSATNSLGDTEAAVNVDLLPERPQPQGGPHPPQNAVTLTWTVRSYVPIVENVVEYKKEGDKDWKSEKVATLNTSYDTYTVEHTFVGLRHGKYESKLISSNEYGWSEPSRIVEFGILAHRPHHSNKNQQITFDEAPPNDTVLNDQEGTVRTGSQVSSDAASTVPRLVLAALLIVPMLQ